MPKSELGDRVEAGPSQPLSPTQHTFRRRLLDKLASGRYRLEQVPTCLCGSGDSIAVALTDRFGLPVGVVVCRACGLLRTTPRLAVEHLPAFYEEDYHGLHFGLPSPDPERALYRVGQGRAILEYVRDRLPAKALTVVEVGCGTGSVLREFAAAAADAGLSVGTLGCEYAGSYVAAGRSLATDIRHGGIDALAGIEPPDLVILSHVLEHFADVPGELLRLRSLISPATMVYVEVPGVLSIDRKPEYEYDFLRYLTIAHTYHFCLDTLVATMGRSGFHLLRGDEEVRSLFASADGLPTAARNMFEETHRYLVWLDGSWRQRARRLALRLRRRSRALGRSMVTRIAGERGLAAVKAVLRRGNGQSEEAGHRNGTGWPK